MIVVYYRERNFGTIIKHEIIRGKTMQEIKERVERFNAQEDGECDACIVEAEKDSFIEYLVNRNEINIITNRDKIDYALNKIEIAKEAVMELYAY